jgi:hypothetical protein
MSATRIWVAALFILMITGLAAIGFSTANQLACEGQLINYRLTPSDEQQIWGERSLGQSFTAPRNGLNRIDLLLQTYQRHNNEEVELQLLPLSPDGSNPLQAPPLVTLTFNAAAAQDRSWHSFTFPPILDSAGKQYLVVLSSPESSPGNAITVGGIEWDVYAPGSAFLGPAPVLADVAFRTCYQMSLAEKLSVFTGQLTHERPGLWGHLSSYGLSLGVYLLLLAAFFWKLTHLSL